jgi:hypothetical protein
VVLKLILNNGTRFIEKTKDWHNSLSSRAKLFCYGGVGNAALSTLDLLSSSEGGKGALINAIHNISDVGSYATRSVVAGGGLNHEVSKRILNTVNLAAIALTGLVSVRAGLDLASGRDHVVEASSLYLSLVSSSGNFAIAGALADTDDKESVEHAHEHEHKHEHEHAHGHGSDHAGNNIAHRAAGDGHHHAKTDAWASLVAAGGLSLASLTGDSRWDSLGALAGGAYFMWHMAKHIKNDLKPDNGDTHHSH